MEQIRSFIAVELPDELKSWLASLQDSLKSGEQHGVKWVNPYSIHLTLKFLGNIDIDRTNAIVRVMQASAQVIRPFHLEVKDLGAFPNLRRAQVIWVGVSGELDLLIKLQQHLESKLTPLGFTAEVRHFSPHLTLARLRNQASLKERQNLGDLISNIKFKAAYSIEVKTISLMRSHLTREGAIYNQISSVELNKSLPTTTT
jgi:2'-5' RNA ligase